jgi:mRNA interferase RelE/StbE
MSRRFEIRLIPEAEKEYKKLDGSMKKLVNVAFRKLEERADELGEELFNKTDTKLLGCRKIKFRKHGIRIVYRIIKGKVEIVQVIAVAKRDDNEVYRLAHKRLEELLYLQEQQDKT